MPISVNQIGGHVSKRQVAHRVVSLTNVAAQVVLATNAQYMMVENIGTSICYIGSVGVTTSQFAFWMTPKARHDFGNVSSGFNFYGILGGALATTLGVMEDA